MSSTPSLPQDALQLSHMGFAVHDIAAMSSYYREVLDFRITDQGKLGDIDLVFLSRNQNEHHQIVWIFVNIKVVWYTPSFEPIIFSKDW